MAHRLGVWPVGTAVLRHGSRAGLLVETEYLRETQQPGAPAGNHRRVEHDHPAHPRGPAQRGHQGQEAAQRMADQPHRALGAVTRGAVQLV